MPKATYSKQEIYVMDQLEHLFWIEIAKRKSILKLPDTSLMLLELRSELDVFFESDGKEFEFPSDSLTEVFFDIVQFNLTVESKTADRQHINSLKAAVNHYKDRVQEITNKLTYHEGFRLADFSVVTDLEAVLTWWLTITTKDGRSLLGTNGRFETMGIVKIAADEEVRTPGEYEPTTEAGEIVDTYMSYPNPAQIPKIVSISNTKSFSTDHHEIIIDGKTLNDKIILSIDLLEPLTSIRQIEIAILTTQQEALLRRAVDNFARSNYSKDTSNHFSALLHNRILELLLVSEDRKLMTEQKNSKPFIVGFYCWDLCYKDGKSRAHAAKITSNDLHLSAQKTAVDGLDKVTPLIECYEPNQLPWRENR